MKKFNKITIIGVGLIGGSIGLAVKKKKLAKVVTGLCRRKSSARMALKAKAVDEVTLDPRAALNGADLVIIASPVGRIAELARQAARATGHSFIMTDVGSTKHEIVARAERTMPGRIRFIGSHPMAGSEQSGVESAKVTLFNGSLCIVTRTGKSDPRAFASVKKFWKELGAFVKVMDPAAHDRLVAYISHVPHVAAAALVNAAVPESMVLASTGFADTTRIASGDPVLWHDILMTNRRAVRNALSVYKKAIRRVEVSLGTGKSKRLLNILQQAKDKRDRI